MPTEYSLTAQRDGTVNLEEATRLAGRTLKRGRYEFSSRLSEAGYRLRVIEVRPEYPLARSSWQWKNRLGEITCRVEPLDRPERATHMLVAPRDGAAELVWIDVARAETRCLPEAWVAKE